MMHIWKCYVASADDALEIAAVDRETAVVEAGLRLRVVNLDQIIVRYVVSRDTEPFVRKWKGKSWNSTKESIC